jgi:hypothetical protein
MNEADVFEWIAEMLRSGQITKNADGTFSLSPELEAKAKQMINERPELYAKIFPERLQ